MRRIERLSQTTRRAVMKAAAGLFGTAAVAGSGSGHPTVGLRARMFEGNEPEERSANVDLESYHSLGGVGPESTSGDASDPHFGGLFEFRTADDIAVISVFSSRRPTPQRGLAVLDISDFTRAESQTDLNNASLTVLSFVRNDNGGAAWMDAKLSDDGQYVFVSQQPFPAAFLEAGDGVTTDGHSADPDVKGALVVDISDPGNPSVVAKGEGQSPTGPHNAWYHQIGGAEYMFTNAGDVFEFDRSTETLRNVAFWDLGGHDLVIQEDPRHGIPIMYYSDWDGGLRLFDVSDPTVGDVTEHELGVFEMERAHFSVPTPTLLHGKRLAVAGQENPSSDDGVNVDGGQSGFLYLVDCDPIDAVLAGDESGPVDLGTASDTIPAEDQADAHTELDRWTLFESSETDWGDVPGFQHEQERAEDDEDDFEQYDGFPDYNLSPHNFDINADGKIALGHYHAGQRFIDITSDLELVSDGYHREYRDIPLDATIEELLKATPFHWSSVLRNGVAFTGGINAGAHVFGHDDLRVGSDPVLDADVDLEVDGSIYTASRTARIDVTVDADEPVQARVRLPTEWDILAGDSHEAETLAVENGAVDEFRTLVTFRGVHTDATLTLLVQVDDSTTFRTVGPVEYARPDVDSQFGGGNGISNRLWRKENAAVESVGVLGVNI